MLTVPGSYLMIHSMDGRQRAARAVAARRGEQGMTQQELADAAGVDSKTIYNLESGGRWPIARNRALIEKALGWPLGEMERVASAEPEPPDPLPPGLRDRIRETLNPEQAARVEAAVEAALTGAPMPDVRRRRAGAG
jgi:transcriptional regulator with XRE-family HTH domain